MNLSAATHATIALAHGDQSAVVAARGAALTSWTAGGAERLSSTQRFAGATLMPWPNRIRDGAHAGHRLPINEPERNCALHGLVTDVDWDVTDQRDATVVLAHTVRPEAGYPFALEATVAYDLTGTGVAVELTATNTCDQDAPFGCGSHPWVLMPSTLGLPARTAVPVDDRLLPTGPPQPADPPGPLDSVTVDTCFGDLDRDDDGLAHVQAGPVSVWLDAAFGFIHVCTSPDRSALAIEPVTCAPDAFNTGVGLITLAPGRRFTGRWGMTLTEETT